MYLILNLQDMPSRAQYFAIEPNVALNEKVNICVFACSDCNLVQLANDPVHYFRETIRSTNVSSSMRLFRLEQLAQFLNKYQLWNKSAIEIGCGYGDILQLFKEVGYNCDGLEENKHAVTFLQDSGFSVSHGYPSSSKTLLDIPKYDVFFSFNVLEHSPNPLEYLKIVNSFLLPGGLGLIEVPNFNLIRSRGLISEFMIEHLAYFDSSTFSKILGLAGFEILKMNEIWYDYILSAEVRKMEFVSFDSSVRDWEVLRLDIQKYLSSFPHETLCVWGAGHQSLTTVSMLGLKDFIRFFVDSSERKQGRFAPAVGKPIFGPAVLSDQSSPIENVLVLAGSYSEEVIALLKTRFANRFSILQINNSNFEILR